MFKKNKIPTNKYKELEYNNNYFSLGLLHQIAKFMNSSVDHLQCELIPIFTKINCVVEICNRWAVGIVAYFYC